MPVKNFFSVIIPTYNRAYLIEKTLNSVFSQTYPNFEVIVIDDCSTDNTQQVLEPWIANNKIKYFRNECNMERSYSRNKGMELASGEYLTFLDSDDLMLPDNLKDAYNAIQNNQDYKFFHNLYHLVDSNNKLIYKYPFPSLKNRLKAITQGNFLSCIGGFLHKDIYTKYKFDTKLHSSEDWEFWIRILADYNLFRISRVNNYMVSHENRSINHQLLKDTIENTNYLNSKVFSDPHLNKIYFKFRKRLRASSYLYVVYIATTSNQFTVALQYLYKALITNWKVLYTYRYLRLLQISVFNILIGRN